LPPVQRENVAPEVAQVRPPSNETAERSPRAAPLDQRSCCQAATEVVGVRGVHRNVRLDLAVDVERAVRRDLVAARGERRRSGDPDLRIERRRRRRCRIGRAAATAAGGESEDRR
jgi:hypothetical protein